MKKFIIGAIAVIASFQAEASGLSIVSSSAIDSTSFGTYSSSFAGTNLASGNRTSGVTGTIFTTATSGTGPAGLLEVVYLGQSSGDSNIFTSGSISFGENTAVGTSFTRNVGSIGALNFSFTNTTLGSAAIANGSSQIAIMDGSNTQFGNFDFLVGFNDKLGGVDFNDFVVGLRYTPNNVSAVPVPAALPLMASALGFYGMGRRRSKAKSV